MYTTPKKWHILSSKIRFLPFLATHRTHQALEDLLIWLVDDRRYLWKLSYWTERNKENRGFWHHWAILFYKIASILFIKLSYRNTTDYFNGLFQRTTSTDYFNGFWIVDIHRPTWPGTAQDIGAKELETKPSSLLLRSRNRSVDHCVFLIWFNTLPLPCRVSLYI